ncbi:MAG: PQQ-dependent sugar dehydrogenase [Chitinophagaceae bacterium]|nr:PQQ-dependent sugar dehydrogenase [Chitinophagaceae bacterium]
MKLIRPVVLILLSSCILTTSDTVAQQDTTVHVQKEEDFYTIQSVPIPDDILLEVGGMTFLPNDELAVSTRRGDVWIITNPYMKNGARPHYRLFARGMHEVLGINFIRGDIYAVQRSELTRLRDLDGDGEADEYTTVYSWPLAGNYHEFAYGPVLDKDGNMIITLNLAWVRDHGESLSKWHGWMIKISPDGKMTPFAAGMRSPAGMGLNDQGDIFYSENQGDWVASGSITHVAAGDFVGNPASLVWSGLPESNVKLKKEDIPDTNEPKYDVAQRVPGLKPPSVWFPHTILGISTSDILNYNDEGKMGPFKGQLLVGDQGQSKIMRVYLEKVKGVYQGAVFPFREGFSSGILRMKWGSDGSMFVGMTSRGWGSTGKARYGLQRLSWNGKTPFEMEKIEARPDGFEITFTQPIDVTSARNASSFAVTRFTYQYHHNYGSPIINSGSCPVRAIEVSADRRKVRLLVDSLKLGYIHEIKAEGVLSAERNTLLHDFGYYTLNQIPEGSKLAITSNNRVQLAQHQHAANKTSRTSVPATTGSKRTIKMPASWNNKVDRTIVMGTKPGLRFDQTTLTVKAGQHIKLVFNNNDDMMHNIVIARPGAANTVGEAATKLGLAGEKVSYVPETQDVLYYTRLLGPTQSETIYFTAPLQPGTYPYICTFPGHYQVMRGELIVTR